MIATNNQISSKKNFQWSSNLIVFGGLLGLKIATGALFMIIAKNFDVSADNTFNLNFWEEIVAAVVVAPMLETLIATFIPIELTLRLLKNSRFKVAISVGISSLIFSLNHPYNAFYMIATFFSGLIYASAYILFKKRQLRPFIITCLIHSGYNSFALIMNKIL